MAETNIPIEPALPTKRKMDSISSEKTEEEGNQGHPIKTQKLRSAAAANNGNTSPAPEENNTEGITPAPSSKDFGSSRQENAERAGICENGVAEEGYDDEDEDDDDDDDEDDGDEEEEEEDAVVDGEPVVVDRKGKGIMIEEKDDEDDDSDDDEDGGSEFDGDDDSDLEDDPLAEVDLDNILPSRTRRRSVLPGVYIANDNDDGDEDDSDE